MLIIAKQNMRKYKDKYMGSQHFKIEIDRPVLLPRDSVKNVLLEDSCVLRLFVSGLLQATKVKNWLVAAEPRWPQNLQYLRSICPL